MAGIGAARLVPFCSASFPLWELCTTMLEAITTTKISRNCHVANNNIRNWQEHLCPAKRLSKSQLVAFAFWFCTNIIIFAPRP